MEEFIINALKAIAQKPKQTVKADELISALSFFYDRVKLISHVEGDVIRERYEAGNIIFTLFHLDGFILRISVHYKNTDKINFILA